MFRLPARFTKPCTLASEWRALLYMAFTLARQILLIAPSDPRRALKKTEMLEAWCFMALAELSCQIDAEDPAAHARKPYSAQLPPIAVILQMLLVFIARTKARLKAHISQRAFKRPLPLRARVIRQPCELPGYIDTS